MRFLDMGDWPVHIGFTGSRKAFCEAFERYAPGDELPVFRVNIGTAVKIDRVDYPIYLIVGPRHYRSTAFFHHERHIRKHVDQVVGWMNGDTSFDEDVASRLKGYILDRCLDLLTTHETAAPD